MFPKVLMNNAPAQSLPCCTGSRSASKGAHQTNLLLREDSRRRSCDRVPGKKPTRLQTLYFSALGCVPSSSSSIEADPHVAASLFLIFVLFACLVGFHSRGESDFVRLESSGRFLLPPSLLDGRDHTLTSCRHTGTLPRLSKTTTLSSRWDCT